MSKRILIVEDTKNIREIVAYMLRNRGYEVLEAADGDEGWKKIEAEQLDLVVLDAMLPGKTGFDICADLKNEEKYANLPVIMLTAITQDSGKDDAYWKERSGADDFVSKPFRAQDLVGRIERLMGVEGESKK